MPLLENLQYEVPPVLRAAIAADPRPLHVLGYPFGITQPQISRALTTPFGPGLKLKLERLGSSLGLPPASCTLAVPRRSARTSLPEPEQVRHRLCKVWNAEAVK